jgi:hypothetical protein
LIQLGSLYNPRLSNRNDGPSAASPTSTVDEL